MDIAFMHDRFLDFLDMLNKNQGTIIVVFTGLLVYLNQKLAKETRRIREADSEPNVEVYLVPHEQSSAFLNMVVKNSGGGPARNIKWSIDYDKENASKKRIQIFKMSMFHVLHYIPAKEQFKFFFGSSIELLQEPKMKPIKISVEYVNDFNKNKQSKKFVIDIEPWEGMATIGRPPVYDIAEHMKEIKKILHDSLTGWSPPLFRIQSEEEYQAEQEARRKEDEEYFEKEREKKAQES